MIIISQSCFSICLPCLLLFFAIFADRPWKGVLRTVQKQEEPSLSTQLILSSLRKNISGGPPSSRLQKPVVMLAEMMMKGRPLLHTVLLAIFCISGTLSKPSFHGMEGKAFVFPKPSDNSYILLKPNLDQGLRQLTLCLRFFTDLTRSFSIFSAASRHHDNEILLWRNPDGFEVCVGVECAVFPLPILLERSPFRWESVCTTWDSATGVVQLWLDGKRLPRKGAMKGYKVSADLVVMLGQDQDSYGAKLDVEQSFVGEIAEVYFWDKVLPAKELANFQTAVTPNPLLDWTSLKFETRGYVLTEPL